VLLHAKLRFVKSRIYIKVSEQELLESLLLCSVELDLLKTIIDIDTVLYTLNFLQNLQSSLLYTNHLYFYRAMLCRARLCHSKSSARMSVCLSVTFRYDFHTGWNTSKIISGLISLRYPLGLTQRGRSWSNRNTSKIGRNRGGVRSTKTLQYLRNGARYVAYALSNGTKINDLV